MSHRDALLAGARRCLQERGYARTTARDLIAASGANLASIGYHFGSKEELLRQALSQAITDWTDQVTAVAARTPDDATPWARLRASLEDLSASFDEQRPIMVAFVEALAQAEREPALRRELAGFYDQLRGAIAAMLLEVLGPLEEVQAHRTASVLIAIGDGLLVQWLLDPEHAPGGGEALDALHSALDAGLGPCLGPGRAPGEPDGWGRTGRVDDPP